MAACSLLAATAMAHNQKRGLKKHENDLRADRRLETSSTRNCVRSLRAVCLGHPPRPRSSLSPTRYSQSVPPPRVPTLPPHHSVLSPTWRCTRPPYPLFHPRRNRVRPDPVKSAKPTVVVGLAPQRPPAAPAVTRPSLRRWQPKAGARLHRQAEGGKAAAHRAAGETKEADEVEHKLDYNHREAFPFTAPNIATSSVRSRDQYQRVAAHGGLRVPSGREAGSEGDTATAGHRNDSDLWLLYYNHKLKFIRTVLDIGVEIKRVQQAQPVPVWCVEVPEPHLIFVRRVTRVEDNIITKASRPIIVSNSKVICNKIHGSLGHLISAYLMSIHIQPRPIYLVRTGKCEGKHEH